MDQRVARLSFRARGRAELTSPELRDLEAFFDAEYLGTHGGWSPEHPYGYAPADVHVLAFDGDRLVAHVGFQRRRIAVGGAEVVVAGVGGVLVDARARGLRAGSRVMRFAQDRMRDDPDIEFGYLGCRPEVVPFYESTGWRRIRARERCVSRLDPTQVVETTDGPILICDAGGAVDEWPAGDIDLRGLPW